MTLISSCHWKTFLPFCSRKIRPDNPFLTLTVNYRKIVQIKNDSIQNNIKLAIFMIYDHDVIYSLLVWIEK